MKHKNNRLRFSFIPKGLGILTLCSLALPLQAAEKQLSLNDAIKQALKVNLGMPIPVS